MKKKSGPMTLLEVIQYFADERRAFDYLAKQRWGNCVHCPRCTSEKVKLIETRLVWRCNACKCQFSVKVGTIFEDSPIKLSKWLPAMWLLANAKNGISSYELHRSIGVTQKTAWFMLQRLRLALQNGSFTMLSGHIEADETYIGGKARNMHSWRRKEREDRGLRGGSSGKTIVMGMLERGQPGESKVIAHVIKKPTRETLTNIILNNVDRTSQISTDQNSGYQYLPMYYQHGVVNHALEYVRDNIHTNSLENFWSLLKRSLNGTYVSVEPMHLHRYVSEQVFRFNNRIGNDEQRFHQAVSQVVGKRLTYAELTSRVWATG